MNEVEFLELRLLLEDSFNLCREGFVPDLFVVEVFRPFRGVVYNFGDLRQLPLKSIG